MDYNKKSKEELVKEIENLKKQQDDILFVAKNVEDMFYKVSLNDSGQKHVDYVSPQVKDILGITVDEYKNSNDKLFEYFHPDELDSLRDILKSKSKSKRRWQISYRFYNKLKKRYVWLEESVNYIINDNGENIGIYGSVKDITQERETERNLSFILKSIKECLYSIRYFDGKRDFTYVSPQVKDMLGLTERQFIKEGTENTLIERVHPDDKSKVIDVVKNSIYDEKLGFIDLVYRFLHKSKKEYRWINEKINVKYNVDGKIEESTTILRDITDDKNKQELLENSEKQYKDLIEKSPYGILIHKAENILFINPKAKILLGIDDSNIENITAEDIIPERFLLKVRERMGEVMEKKELPFIEIQAKNIKTGKILDVESKILLTRYQGEDAIQVVFSDITDKKLLAQQKVKTEIAEETNKILQKEISERKKVEKELVLSKSYNQNIISSSLDVIVATDEDNKIREFNKAAEYVFGYTREEILNKKTGVLYGSKKEHQRVMNQLQKHGFFVGEIQNIRKNGVQFTSFLSASQLYNEEGKVMGAMGVSRDITEIKQAEIQLRESEEKYRDLFENATDLIQSVDEKGKILYVNNSWLKTLNYRSGDLKDISIYDVIHSDYHKDFKSLIKEAFQAKSRKSFRKRIALVSKDGIKIYVEADFSCRLDDKGKPVTIRGILRDITDKRWTEKLQAVYNNVSKIITEMSSAEEMYDALRLELGTILNTDVFVISYALDKNTLTFPYYYDKSTGGRVYRPTRRRKKGINELFLKYKKPKILYRNELDKLIKQDKYELLGNKCKVFVGVPLKVKNKVIGVLSVQSYKDEHEFNIESLEVLDFISGALALTVQKKFDEHKLFEQSAKLSSIIESSTHMFWTYDLVKGLTTFNQNYYETIHRLYGIKAKLHTHTLSQLEEKEAQAFWSKKYDKAFEGKGVEFVMERHTTAGERKIYEIFLNPILDEDGDVKEVAGIAHDITEKKIGEEKLRDSLKEKEVLLKEVHHRVKNNLQVISSILNLQSSYVTDDQTLDILRESQNRIKSMSIIHESLYQTNDFSNINFSKYIVSLSKNLVHSYVNFDKFIDLNHDIDDVSLNLDTSIPCGLIVNELVSNALKYAFEGRQKGEINIFLKSKKDDITLSVQDNGVGFPKDLDYRESNSLGLQLVVTLVEQVEGTIEMEVKKGTIFTIKFKKA